MTTPTDPVERAAHHGAVFEQRGPLWVAIARVRGRKLPLVEFLDTSKAEAARAFLAYFHKT